MKMLVTGGNRGLGQHLVNTFGADSLSRAQGVDITTAAGIDRVVKVSVQYDVVINNAFDGPPHEPWANFAQVNLYMALYHCWRQHEHSGHIFNIGSVGCRSVVAPDPEFETYRISKAALEHASRQGTQAFKQNIVPFRTTLVTLDRLDTALSRSRSSWTGNGLKLTDISQFVTYAISINSNTCIEDITFYCNLSHSD